MPHGAPSLLPPFVATIAHYDMGMSREAIRTDALCVAGFLFAGVVVIALFKRRNGR
jgi:hypothetical protein